jgi:hypothetical protein
MDVHVDSTLESTSSVHGCAPAYKLYAFSPYTNAWITWDKLVAQMENEVSTGKLQSRVHFNEYTGDFNGNFFKPEIVELTSTFTTAGKTSIKYKTKSVIPGSTAAGPSELQSGTPPEAEFEIVILDDTSVDSCKTNKLTVGSRTTKSSTDRASTLSYQIPLKDASAALSIEANEVISTVAGCTIETTAEWYNG